MVERGRALLPQCRHTAFAPGKELATSTSPFWCSGNSVDTVKENVGNRRRLNAQLWFAASFTLLLNSATQDLQRANTADMSLCQLQNKGGPLGAAVPALRRWCSAGTSCFQHPHLSPCSGVACSSLSVSPPMAWWMFFLGEPEALDPGQLDELRPVGLPLRRDGQDAPGPDRRDHALPGPLLGRVWHQLPQSDLHLHKVRGASAVRGTARGAQHPAPQLGRGRCLPRSLLSLCFSFSWHSSSAKTETLFPCEQAKLESLKKLSCPCYLAAVTGGISGQAGGCRLPPLSCSTTFLDTR